MSEGNTNGKIARFTAQKLSQLYSQSGERSFRAILAHLRRGIGCAPGEMPQLWGLSLIHIYKRIAEYIRRQLEEDQAGEQLTMGNF